MSNRAVPLLAYALTAGAIQSATSRARKEMMDMSYTSRAGLEVKPGTLHVECWLLLAVDWVHQPTWLGRWANELNVDLARMKQDLMAGRSYDQVVLDHYAEERRATGGRLDGDPPEALP
ncbi:hypothetical protein LTR10_012397 [Elasticomyces elasticus]|nr:hypothetical protein LTR10_012397 [Elasticomyces elasticus]KAK4965872.1 hypothetical protein LTR42_011886 [Elasticomyces elasticus]